ncbi:MAG: PAS domain-containing protein, partial [Lachnospiraceae bacterium]|nr:PAS domain-containing protein [Lachnospiraceae bacterium]
MDNYQENIVSYIENLITGVIAFELKEGSYNLTCVYANEGLSRMLGYSKKDIDKYVKNIRYCILPEDIPVFDQGIRECLKADGAVNTEFRTITGKGELRWLYTRCNLYSKVGDTYTIIATVIDVTEKKTGDEELRAQAARMHLIDTVEKESIFDYNVKSDVLDLKYIDEDQREKEIIIPDYVAKFDSSYFASGEVEKYLACFNKLMTGPINENIVIKSKRFSKDFKEYDLTLSSIVGLEGYVTRIVGRFIDKDKLKEDNESSDKKLFVDYEGLSLRESAMKTLYDGMLSKDSWDRVYNMLLTKSGCSFGGIFPDVNSLSESNDITMFTIPGYEYTFEDDKAKRRAAAEFEDLFKNVKNFAEISDQQATGYSYSLSQFMTDNGFEKIIYYPFVKEGKYVGCIVLFNPVNDEEIDTLELKQLISLIDTCTIQITLSDFDTREMMIKLLMLEFMDQYIYLVDYESKRLLFANKKVFDRSDDI